LVQEIPELASAGQYHAIDAVHKKIEDFRTKWNLEDISYSLLCRWDMAADNIAEFETLLAADGGHSPLYPAVGSHFDGLGILRIFVDLRNSPLDVLLGLVEAELRLQAKKFEALLRRGAKVLASRYNITEPPRRRRLDKVELQLAVFDRAMRGQTFTAIARELRKPVGTVKRAYYSAVNQIFGTGRIAAKKELTLQSFDDAERHWKTCPDCSRASTADEACPQMRLLVNQDSRGRRERLGLDTTRDVAGESATEGE
jgi:hypothetical protein